MPSGRTRVGMTLMAALVLALAPATGDAAEPSTTPGSVGASSLRVPGSCPRTRAVGAIRSGMTGIGWTTVRGDRPEPFRVRVLGTLHDGIGPGRDLVVIKVSDLPGRRVVRLGGGIWSGMSGSPVYIRGRLAGAISYSLADGPSPVGGMTPARYMERLADEARRTGVSARPGGPGSRTAGREVARVSGTLGDSVAAEAGRTAGRGVTLRRLGIPVAASGSVGTRRSFVLGELRRQLGSVRIVSTGAASSSTAARLATPPRAGQNLAGVIAQGDVTVAAVGTVTEVCRGRVVGFGHPMTGAGSVAYAAGRARTVVIVDGNDPYKLANLGRTFGTLDVDRLTGVRAVSGDRPRMLPITARVRSSTTGRVRTGRTLVASPAWMPTVAADHVLYDIQAVDERSGGGTAELEWTIRGTRLDTGAAWTLHRSDRVTDVFDMAYAAAVRLYTQLDTLANDPGTEARITSVSIDATVSSSAVVDRIRRIEVARNGGPWQRGGPIAVTSGDRLQVRVSMRPRTGRTYSRVVSLTVPSGVAGEGVLDVLGGATWPMNGCDPLDGSCPSTFGRSLDALRAAPRGDEVTVTLDMEGAGGGSVRVSTVTRLGRVVEGERRLRVQTE